MYDNDFDLRDDAFSTDDLDLGVTSAAFMKAAAPRIRSKPCTPVGGGYKASSLKQPLNGRLKGTRMKRRSVSFAPNALTWSHDGQKNGRQKLKNSCEEENGEEPDGMPSPVNNGRPTATQQFSHLPAFLQPEAPVRANGSADGVNSSDSDSDGSRPDSSDDDTFFTPTVNPTPTPALLANGTKHSADSDSGNDSDRSGASLSVASQATNVETESENEKENIPNGNTNDAAAAGSGNDSDGSMVAGDSGNDSDGSVVFGSDDANKSDEEIPEFAKRKPTVLPTVRQRRLRMGILGASGSNSPLAEAKKGLSQGLSQLPGNRRFQPRLSSWSKKRREMSGLRPPPSYSRLQARKALEAPSPIRRSDVYNVPSPTNAQGEESNTPKEGLHVKRTLEVGETASIVCSPVGVDAARSSSSTNTVIVKDTNGLPPAMNGETGHNEAHTVSSADLKEVHTEIDSLKKMTHSVIEKLDSLSATFDELRHLNLAGRLDDQASTFGELKHMVSSHAQSTNDRITDLSTVVETLSNRVDSSHHLLESHADFIKRQEGLESKAVAAAAESVSSPKGSRSPRSPRRGRRSSRDSSSSSSLDSLHESISELRAFTKENFERVQRSQDDMFSSPRSRASSSPTNLSTQTLNRRLSTNARKGRSKHAQQQARLARRGSAPGAKSSLAGSAKSREARPVRPRLCGYGSIAFLVMVLVLVWYFFPAIAPLLHGASRLT